MQTRANKSRVRTNSAMKVSCTLPFITLTIITSTLPLPLTLFSNLLVFPWSPSHPQHAPEQAFTTHNSSTTDMHVRTHAHQRQSLRTLPVGTSQGHTRQVRNLYFGSSVRNCGGVCLLLLPAFLPSLGNVLRGRCTVAPRQY